MSTATPMLYSFRPALPVNYRAAIRTSLVRAYTEPLLAVGKEEALGHDAQDAPGIVEAFRHLADHRDVGRDGAASSRNAAWYQRRPR